MKAEYTVRLDTRITPEQEEIVQGLMELWGCTRSQVVRRLIDNAKENECTRKSNTRR